MTRASCAKRQFGRSRLKGDEHRGVPGKVIRRVGILNAAIDVGQQMRVLAEIVACAKPNARRLRRALDIGRLPRRFQPELQIWKHLARDDRIPRPNLQARPSLWAEPMGDWGDGDVRLVEIPSKSET